MALETQIDKLVCGINGVKGTGQEACSIDWDRVSTIKLTKRNYKFTQEDTLENIQLSQQKEEIIIVNNIDSFALVPQEVVYDTTDGSGKKSVSGELPYEYDLMFKEKGENFWKAMRSLDSKGQYDISFYDVFGNEFFTQNKSGAYKGFGTYLIKTSQYKGKEGNTPASFTTKIQLSDYTEMERMRMISSNELDYSAQSDLAGVNDTTLIASPLSVSGTTLTVSALLLDKNTFVDGLLNTDFLVKKDGVTVAHTAAVPNANAKTYAIAIPASSAGTYTIQFYDDDINANVVQNIVTLGLYKSNIASVVVS